VTWTRLRLRRTRLCSNVPWYRCTSDTPSWNAFLTPAQEASLAALPAALAELGVDEATAGRLGREERCSFLKLRGWKAADAAAQIKEAAAWLDSIGPVTIDQVAPFMRTARGRAKDSNLPNG